MSDHRLTRATLAAALAELTGEELAETGLRVEAERERACQSGEFGIAAMWHGFLLVLDDERERRLEEADESDYQFLGIIEDFHRTEAR